MAFKWYLANAVRHITPFSRHNVLCVCWIAAQLAKAHLIGRYLDGGISWRLGVCSGTGLPFDQHQTPCRLSRVCWRDICYGGAIKLFTDFRRVDR